MCIRDRSNTEAGSQLIANQKAVSCFDNYANNELAGAVPVSYTHLDVYKRQVDTQRGADLPFGFRIVLPDAEKQRTPVFRNQNPGCVYLSGADEE